MAVFQLQLTRVSHLLSGSVLAGALFLAWLSFKTAGTTFFVHFFDWNFLFIFQQWQGTLTGVLMSMNHKTLSNVLYSDKVFIFVEKTLNFLILLPATISLLCQVRPSADNCIGEVSSKVSWRTVCDVWWRNPGPDATIVNNLDENEFRSKVPTRSVFSIYCVIWCFRNSTL